VRLIAVSALVLLAGWPPAMACNPDPPRPPILERYAYDRLAAETLLRDARSVVAARLSARVDLELGAPPNGTGVPAQTHYVFEVLEGWQEETARRLTLSGLWISCALTLRTGRTFLLYLQGERLLHAVPVEQIDFELALFGEPDWFYDARGQLVRPLED
jgi:hypothetical protein